ncbi:MAG TPA: DNA repair protein RecO, partial [Leptospiraceae bacterium]|nr:DNA repair protein RecO [Leptospiraceae bacterium]
ATRQVGEADAVITILGESGTKAKYKLKGIKKSKNRPILASELGALIAIDYYQHKNEEIHNIKEVSLIERFEKIKETYEGYLLITYFCELMDTILPNGDSHEKCFELLNAAFHAINEENFQPLILPFFKLKLLSVLGLVSRELICHSCEEDMLLKNAASINSIHLDITCGDCMPPSKNQISIIKLMDRIFKSRYATLSKEETPISLISQLDQILNDYLRAYLNVTLKTFDLFYKSLGGKYEIRN